MNFIDGLDDNAGDAADEGTILHSFCEDFVADNLDPFKFIGQEREHNGYRYKLTEIDAQQISDAMDRIDDIPGKMFIEKRLDLGRWLPGQFGTMDLGFKHYRRATIWDWKWGFIPVSPVENDQMRLYGLGFWDKYIADDYPDLEEFHLIIEQPRAPGGGGEWKTTVSELLDFGRWAAKRGQLTYDPDAPRIAGEKQCQYCPGAKERICPEYDKFNLDMIVRDFDEMDEQEKRGFPIRMPDVKLLSPERRSFIVRHRAMIDKYLDRLHAECMDDALKGREVPRLKAVAGRKSPDKWENEKEAEERLRRVLPPEKLYKKTLISVAQTRGVLSERLMNGLKDFIKEGERKPVLVDEDDERPRLKTVAEEFEDED